MKTLTCSYRDFSGGARFVYFAGPNGPEQHEAPETPKLPDAKELTTEHVDTVIKAVDSNIKATRDYYEDYVVKSLRHIEMPKDLQTQIAKLEGLKSQLQQLRSNPANARAVMTEIYKVFGTLRKHAEKVTAEEETSHDPLAGLGFSVYSPELRAEEPAAKGAPEKGKEAKESQQQLVRDAVENIARAGGELTQDMLDALSNEFKAQKTDTLAYSIDIDGNPVLIFVKRSPDGAGFRAQGVKYNAEEPLLDQASTWKTASFNVVFSFRAGGASEPSVPETSVPEMVAKVKKGNRLNVTKLG